MILMALVEAVATATPQPHGGFTGLNEWAPTFNLGLLVTIGGAVAKGLWTYKRDKDQADEKAQKRVDDKIDKLAVGWETRIAKVEGKSEVFLPESRIKEMIHGEVDELKHKLANERQRIDAVVATRVQDVERIVKLETNIANIEKGQERIEKAVEKNHQEVLGAMKVWADQFAASIREVREVKPKG